MEEALYDMASMRRFAGLPLFSAVVPDETTIPNLWLVLEKNGFAAEILRAVNQWLAEKEGQSMVFRHESAHWRGHAQLARAYSGGCSSQCQ